MLFLFLQVKNILYRNNTLYRIDKSTLGKIGTPADEQLGPTSPSTVIAH